MVTVGGGWNGPRDRDLPVAGVDRVVVDAWRECTRDRRWGQEAAAAARAATGTAATAERPAATAAAAAAEVATATTATCASAGRGRGRKRRVAGTTLAARTERAVEAVTAETRVGLVLPRDVARRVEARGSARGLGRAKARRRGVTAVDRGAAVGSVRPTAGAAGTAERAARSAGATASAATGRDEDAGRQGAGQRAAAARADADVGRAAAAGSVSAVGGGGAAIGAACVTGRSGDPAVGATEAAERPDAAARPVAHAAGTKLPCAVDAAARDIHLQHLPRCQLKRAGRLAPRAARAARDRRTVDEVVAALPADGDQARLRDGGRHGERVGPDDGVRARKRIRARQHAAGPAWARDDRGRRRGDRHAHGHGHGHEREHPGDRPASRTTPPLPGAVAHAGAFPRCRRA